MNAMIAATVYCIVGCNTGSPDKDALKVLECDTETGAAKIVQSVQMVCMTVSQKNCVNLADFFPDAADFRLQIQKLSLPPVELLSVARRRATSRSRPTRSAWHSPCTGPASPEQSESTAAT